MAVSVILNFDHFSTFDLDDIEGRVIFLFKGFPEWGVSPFLELFLVLHDPLCHRDQIGRNYRRPRPPF